MTTRILILLALLAAAPALLHATPLSSAELQPGDYVYVTYFSEDGTKRTAEGNIRAVEAPAVTIGRGLWNERILYQNILTLTLERADGERATLIDRRNVPLAAGARVRIAAPAPGPGFREGTVVALRPGALDLRAENGDTLAVPLASLKRLAICQGVKRRTGYGFLAGATLGTYLGLTRIRCNDEGGFDHCHFPAPGKVFLYTAASGLIGAGIGALITTEQWEDAPVENLRVGVLANPSGGAALTASFNF